MLTTGAFLIWTIVIWRLRTNILRFFQSIHIRDQQRLAALRNRLHLNFVFRKDERIQTWARRILFCGVMISIGTQCMSVFFTSIISYFIFPTLWIRWLEYTRDKKFNRQLLYVIPSISSMLKAGHGIEKALSEMRSSTQSPMLDELELLIKQMKLGASLEEVLEKLTQRFPSDNLKMFAHAIIISRKLGSSLSEAMDNITENILEKEKLKSQIESLTSQGKMQSYIAVCMPFLLMIVLQAISPGYFDVLFSTTIGKCGVGYGLVSMSLGILWIYRITHKEYL